MAGTLLEAKLALKANKDLRHLLVRGGRNEILPDINGDKEAEIALQDINHDGNIDRLAADIRGEGEFDLFIDDTDMNDIPDAIYLLDEGSDHVKELAAGPEVEQAIKLQREMEKEARQKLRAEKKEDHQQKIAATQDELKAKFNAFWEKFSRG